MKAEGAEDFPTEDLLVGKGVIFHVEKVGLKERPHDDHRRKYDEGEDKKNFQGIKELLPSPLEKIDGLLPVNQDPRRKIDEDPTREE